MTGASVLLGGREVAVRKIICIGRNYAAHAKEMGAALPAEPMLFLKPSTAVARPGGGDLFVPRAFGLLHHEIELAVLLGDGGKDLGAAAAPRLIAGYGVALDLTLRDLQAAAKKGGRPWSLSKGFDGAAPVGDFAPASAIGDVRNLALRLVVNGEVRQEGNTAAMIFPPEEILAYASRFMTLEAGDILLTGTPEGVGPLDDGDEVVASIGGLPGLWCTLRR